MRVGTAIRDDDLEEREATLNDFLDRVLRSPVVKFKGKRNEPKT